MKGIGEFLSERVAKALPAPQAEGAGEAKAAALVVLRESAVPADAQKLANSLEAFASSPEFAKAVDEAVPPPHPGESEEEFVARAKEAIQRILMGKFGR
jgi:hypothetical protein